MAQTGGGHRMKYKNNETRDTKNNSAAPRLGLPSKTCDSI